MKSIVRSSGGKTSKIWLNEGSIFRINLSQGPLQENVKEIYSTKNDGKSLFTEQFIWTMKSKNYKSMSPISKIM